MTSGWNDECLEEYREYCELCNVHGATILNIENFTWANHWYNLKKHLESDIQKEKNMNNKKTMIPDPETDKFLLQVFRSNGDIFMEVFLEFVSIPLDSIPSYDRFTFQIWEIDYHNSYSTGFNYIPYSGKIGFCRE